MEGQALVVVLVVLVEVQLAQIFLERWFLLLCMVLTVFKISSRVNMTSGCKWELNSSCFHCSSF